MRLGVAFSPSFSASWRMLVELANKVGVTAVEVRADDPKLIRKSMLMRFKDLLSSYNFILGVHAPYADVNLASLNPFISSSARRVLSWCIRVSDYLEADYLISHMGMFPSDYPRRLRRKALDNLIRVLRTMAQRANDSNVDLLVENSPKDDGSNIGSTIEEIRHICLRSGLNVALDLGHANTMGSLLDYVNELHDIMKVIHIHDNDGERDLHLPLGRGNLMVSSCLRLLRRFRYEGPLILQVRDLRGLIRSVRRLRNLIMRSSIMK